MLEQLISQADNSIREACQKSGFEELGPTADRHGMLEHVFHRQQEQLDRFVVVSFLDAREEGADKDGLVITFSVVAEGARPDGEHGRYQTRVHTVQASSEKALSSLVQAAMLAAVTASRVRPADLTERDLISQAVSGHQEPQFSDQQQSLTRHHHPRRRRIRAS